VNAKRVEEIANAVLYEGYMLYPYRPSSVKNRQRFNFGVLFPKDYSETRATGEPWFMRTECLVLGNSASILEIKLRFLQLVERTRTPEPVTHQEVLTADEPACGFFEELLSLAQPAQPWQEAIDREICVSATIEDLLAAPLLHPFNLAGQLNSESPVRRQEALQGEIEISASLLKEGLFKISVQSSNQTSQLNPRRDEASSSRDESLMHALVSAHTILHLNEGEFVSLLDPPAGLERFVSDCRNIGNWPVLVGDEGHRDAMLASPIILYDYPQIAPESAGDLCDGTEIDEILALRILTLTDQEKQEMRHSDDRARMILERTESMPQEHFMKLHGVLRGVHRLDEESK
jgi:hypothetical protein